jgi:hypothetical protein
MYFNVFLCTHNTFQCIISIFECVYGIFIVYFNVFIDIIIGISPSHSHYNIFAIHIHYQNKVLFFTIFLTL